MGADFDGYFPTYFIHIILKKQQGLQILNNISFPKEPSYTGDPLVVLEVNLRIDCAVY